MRILTILLLSSSLGAFLPTPTPVNIQTTGELDGGLKVAFINKTALSQLKLSAAEIDMFQKRFSEENHISLLLDLSEFAGKGLVAWWNTEVDVTARVIEAFKESQRTTAAIPSIKVTVPKANIAKLDMRAIYDEKTGIKQWVKRFKEAVKKFPEGPSSPSFREYLKESQDSIFKGLDAFAREGGYNFVFDASAPPPQSVTSLPSTDITRTFIDKYNRLHP